MPLLEIFRSGITEDQIKLANEILDLLSDEYIKDIIYKLPVKLDNQDIMSISDTYLSSDSGYNSLRKPINDLLIRCFTKF